MANVMIGAAIEGKANRAIQEYKKGNKEMYNRLRKELEDDWIII